MGFMDKVKETATKVGDAAQSTAKAGQDKVEELQTKKRIDTLCQQLGAVVYAQRVGDPVPGDDATHDGAIARLVEAIREQKAALAADGQE